MILIIRLIAAALGFWAATALVSGITVNGGAWSYLWVALLFGVINTVLGVPIRFLFLNDITIFALFKGVTHDTASEIIPFLFSNKGTWAGHAAKGNKVYCIVMTNAIVF